MSISERTDRSVVGPKLGRDQPAWSMAVTHEHGLTRPELGEAPTSECLHMHEDVWSLRAAGEKAKPVSSVQPLHHSSFPVALGDNNNMRALLQFRWTDRRRIVHAANADGLQTLRSSHGFADHASPLVSGLEAVASQAGHMQEDFGKVLLWSDKPVAL